MTDIAFYHLQRSTLETVLPKLLERTLSVDKRALVLTGSSERSEGLDSHLWSYKPDSWLPHGTAKGGSPELQPIWISDQDENLNDASFLFLSDGMVSASLETFERCFELFDGNNDENLSLAREHWKLYKDAGHNVTYWQQTEQGGWEQKA